MGSPVVAAVAVALLVFGLIGQGFEMRKIRLSIGSDEELRSKNVFADKRNWKWYAIIGSGLILWVVSGGFT